jgi:hypothetical protein
MVVGLLSPVLGGQQSKVCILWVERVGGEESVCAAMVIYNLPLDCALDRDQGFAPNESFNAGCNGHWCADHVCETVSDARGAAVVDSKGDRVRVGSGKMASMTGLGALCGGEARRKGRGVTCGQCG